MKTIVLMALCASILGCVEVESLNNRLKAQELADDGILSEKHYGVSHVLWHDEAVKWSAFAVRSIGGSGGSTNQLTVACALYNSETERRLRYRISGKSSLDGTWHIVEERWLIVPAELSELRRCISSTKGGALADVQVSTVKNWQNKTLLRVEFRALGNCCEINFIDPMIVIEK